MRLLPPIIAEHVREAVGYAHYSHRAVRNMYEAALGKRERLKLHRVKLDYWLDTEYDLANLLDLAERAGRVETNLERTEAKIRALQNELIKRRLRELA